MFENRQQTMMAIRIGHLQVDIQKAIQEIQDYLPTRNLIESKRRVKTYMIPDKAIFGYSIKVCFLENQKQQDFYGSQLEYIGHLHNSEDNQNILKFFYDDIEFDEDPSKLLQTLGYDYLNSNYELNVCYIMKKDNIEIYIYDAKTQKNDASKYVAEVRFKETDVKELCHLHQHVIQDLSPFINFDDETQESVLMLTGFRPK